jgi:hypothetical protein
VGPVGRRAEPRCTGGADVHEWVRRPACLPAHSYTFRLLTSEYCTRRDEYSLSAKRISADQISFGLRMACAKAVRSKAVTHCRFSLA